MKLSIIIPCYNEQEGINYLYTQLNPILEILEKTWKLELIFVDDGSTDKTNKLIREYFGKLSYIKIIKHHKNRNLGASIRTGFENSEGDVIITMDSDCTYDPKEIFKLIELLDEETDIVTASPYHPKGRVKNVPEYRLLLSKSISLIYRVITKSKIHTFTALFRIHKRKVIENINFKSNNFLATAEIIIYALMKGYKVKEYPTTLQVRKYGCSKMKLFLVIKSHLKFVIKLIKERIFIKKKKGE
jgi:dolichol-phosphate mannosyltransferase